MGQTIDHIYRLNLSRFGLDDKDIKRRYDRKYVEKITATEHGM